MPTRDYRVHMPPDRWIRTACEEAGCEYWRDGWDSPVDERTEQGRVWAWLIRHESRRTFRELRREDGVTVFRFEPGQRCFTEHRTRPVRLSVATGGLTLRTHSSLAGLAEDYTEHCGRLADQYQRG